MTLDAETLGKAVKTLIEKGLAERLEAPGGRVPKFRHDIGSCSAATSRSWSGQ